MNFCSQKNSPWQQKKGRGDACVELNWRKVDGVDIQAEERPKSSDGRARAHVIIRNRETGLKEVAKDLKEAGRSLRRSDSERASPRLYQPSVRVIWVHADAGLVVERARKGAFAHAHRIRFQFWY